MPTVQTVESASHTLNVLGMHLDPVIITSPVTRQVARRYWEDMRVGLSAPVSLHGLLIALCSAFTGLCDDSDIDPENAFQQIMGTLFRDDTRHLDGCAGSDLTS